MASRAAVAILLAVLVASDNDPGAAALPLQVVKTLSLAPDGGEAGTLGSSFSLSLPPPLQAIGAWKRAIAGAILGPPVELPAPPPPPPPPPPPAPRPPPPPPPPPPPQHVHHHHHYQGGCCCGADSSSSSSEDSSAASSEEDAVSSGEARLQRCVRTVAPNMLVDNSYGAVAQMDACAAAGAQALAGGSLPGVVIQSVSACMAGAAFPAPLGPFVQDFTACVARALS